MSAFTKVTARQSSLSSTTRAKTGAEGIRTPDPHNAIVVLYQLSYDPEMISDCRLRIADCNSQRGPPAIHKSFSKKDVTCVEPGQ